MKKKKNLTYVDGVVSVGGQREKPSVPTGRGKFHGFLKLKRRKTTKKKKRNDFGLPVPRQGA